jgi:thiamine-monophosphate kinase
MEQSVGELGEFGLIGKIGDFLSAVQGKVPGVSLGIGDDCAVFDPPAGQELLITCDSLVEGRHYLRSLITPYELGRRAMVQNISDIGAMGGMPLYAMVSLGLKNDTRVSRVEELYKGFVSELSPLGALIIGGNITSVSDEPFIDITVVGGVARGRAVTRSGSRPGDAIIVTGFPGEAAAGLRLLKENLIADPVFESLAGAYLRPSHRAREGAVVAEKGYATAMIDTSDGLSADLGHICKSSGVGARLDARRFPVRNALREAAGLLACDLLDLILGASDDYELVITCNPEHTEDVRALVSGVCDVPAVEIGRVTREAGRIVLEDVEGERALQIEGWDHFRVNSPSTIR